MQPLTASDSDVFTFDFHYYYYYYYYYYRSIDYSDPTQKVTGTLFT